MKKEKRIKIQNPLNTSTYIILAFDKSENDLYWKCTATTELMEDLERIFPIDKEEN